VRLRKKEKNKRKELLKKNKAWLKEYHKNNPNADWSRSSILYHLGELREKGMVRFVNGEVGLTKEGLEYVEQHLKNWKPSQKKGK
jgi:hypothetical protein